MRRSHLTAAAIVLLLLCGACSPTPGPDPFPTEFHPTASATDPVSTPTEPPAPPPTLGVDPALLRGVTIRIWHAFAEAAYPVFQQQIGQFNASNDWGITVSETGFGDYLTLYEAMQVAIDSDEMPQVVVSLPEQLLEWQALGLLVDLEPYLLDVDFGMGEPGLADFPSAFWEGSGAPAQRSARYLFYNQTWAHELGFTTPPQTPEEFRQQACAANASFKANDDLQDDGFGGWVVDAHWQTAYAWLLAFNASPAAGEGYGFDSEANKEAFTFLKSLYDENCAWLTTDAAPFEAFAARKALFVSGDLAEIPAAALTLEAVGNADEWSLIPYPGLDEPVLSVYGPSYAILGSSPEEQLAAWLFIRWSLSAENQAMWVEATGLLPLRTSVLDLVAPYRRGSPQWEAAALALETSQPPPALASWRQVRYLLADGFERLFLLNLTHDLIPPLLEEMQQMAQELGEG